MESVFVLFTMVVIWGFVCVSGLSYMGPLRVNTRENRHRCQFCYPSKVSREKCELLLVNKDRLLMILRGAPHVNLRIIDLILKEIENMKLRSPKATSLVCRGFHDAFVTRRRLADDVVGVGDFEYKMYEVSSIATKAIMGEHSKTVRMSDETKSGEDIKREIQKKGRGTSVTISKAHDATLSKEDKNQTSILSSPSIRFLFLPNSDKFRCTATQNVRWSYDRMRMTPKGNYQPGNAYLENALSSLRSDPGVKEEYKTVCGRPYSHTTNTNNGNGAEFRFFRSPTHCK